MKYPMKRVSILMFAGLVAISTPGLAQTGDASGMNKDTHSHGASHAATYQAEGTVKKIDAAAGAAMIAHGPVPSLKWPPMTMSFDVRDKKLLQNLKTEQRIRFEFVIEGKRYVITSLAAGDKR